MLQFPSDEVKKGEKIGRGSYWKVYEGRLSGNRCAVKCFKPVFKGEDSDALALRDSIILECSKWLSFDHVNIVKFFGIAYIEASQSIPSLILELMDKSLINHLQNTMTNKLLFPLLTKVSILHQVANGLNYLHSEKNLVHGDLTASNVLLKEDSPGNFVAKLTDFGMSRAVDGRDMSLSSAYGTLNYMPPEILNAGDVSTKVDVYSLGVLMVHMLTHKVPRPSHALVFDSSRVPVAVSEFKRYSHLLMNLTREDKLILPLIESCIQYDQTYRPFMKDIITKIENVNHELARLTSVAAISGVVTSSGIVISGPAITQCVITNSIINLGGGDSSQTEIAHKRDHGDIEDSQPAKVPKKIPYREQKFTSTDVILARTDEDCVERDSAVALHTAADLDRTSHQNQAFMHYKAKLSDCKLRAEAKSPKAIENPRAVYFEGKICLCEGWRVYHQSLYTLDVANGQWSTIQFYDDQEKCGVTLATASGKLYVVGGHWRKDEHEEMYSGNVYVLNDDFSWSQPTLPSLITGRRAATSVGFASYLLVAGGWGNDDTLLSSVEGINTAVSAPYWWEVCDLPIQSHYLQSTVSANLVYFGLGFHTAKLLYSVESSKIVAFINNREIPRSKTGFWQAIPETPYKLSGLGAIDSYLLVVGGRDDKQRRSSAYLYDSHENKWFEVFQAEPARESAAVVTCMNGSTLQLFVLCGWGGNRIVQSMKLDPQEQL